MADAPSEFDILLADLTAKHPNDDVEPLRYAGGRMIVRTPDEGTYAQFVTMSGEPSKRLLAMTTLCRRCILWPSLDVVDGIFARKPGLALRISDKLADKAGAGDEIILGK